MKGFNVIALDGRFGIVSLLRYTNLQWNRKYHEPGTFSIQIPLEQYSSEINYIYTKDRREIGQVSQVNYINQSGYKNVNLSGYFLENQLNRRIAYPKPFVTNIKNNPSWTYREGKAENVAFAFFEAFKDVVFDDIHSDAGIDPPFNSLLGIETGSNQGRGNTARHERNGEQLGSKIYQILKPSGMSFHVDYDFLTGKKIFNVWQGKDRTSEQKGNNPIVFSTKYGNIKNPNVLLDNTSYKNAVIAKSDYQNDGKDITYVKAFIGDGRADDYSDNFIYNETSINRSEYDEDSFNDTIQNESKLLLNDLAKTINVEFDAMEGSYEYMDDFDLGDNTSIEIPEIGISATARLIGCYEVVKSGKWSMTMEFGTPIIKK